MMASRRGHRGVLLADVVFAISLAALLVCVHAQEIARQRRTLAATSGETRARTALLSAYERVRTGVVAVPAPEETRALPAPPGCALSLRRAEQPLHPRLDREDLVPVVLRVTWRDDQGDERSRELTTLARAGGSL